MYDSFYFRRHFLIVTEMMDLNLYSYLKQNNFKAVNTALLKRISKQVLTGLSQLKKLSIIHCDLKPENILFTDPSHKNVKIIDFGSACTEFQNGFTYV